MTPPRKPAAEDINEWLDSFSTQMSDGAINLCQAKASSRGGIDVYKALICAIVAKMVGTAAVHVLMSAPEELKGEKVRYEYVKEAFVSYKAGIQEAVAAAFTAAMSNFSGKELEYYCLIKPVPEPPTKQVC